MMSTGILPIEYFLIIIGYIIMILGILTSLAMYFIPAAEAFSMNHRKRTAILILNIFLGWTLFGWVVSLGWSVTNDNSNKNNKKPAST